MSTDSISIPLEDVPSHSIEYPFCDDGSCLCHEDPELIDEIATLVSDGTLTPDEATDIVNGKYW